MTAYRYEDHVYSGVSHDPGGGEHYYLIGPNIELRTFDVVKITPKGFWIIPVGEWMGGSRKWVRTSSRKKYAHLSMEDALSGFLHRKRKQIRILEKQIERAKLAYGKANDMLHSTLINKSL